MTIQEVADQIGKLGFVPEWRWGVDHQQWLNPATQVRLSVQWLDERIQYRRIVPGRATWSEFQTDSANYGDLQQALRD
jgi:hypothetical protein